MSIWRRFLRKMGTHDLCSMCVKRGICKNSRKKEQGPRRNCRFFIGKEED